jgi:EthD domain
MRVMEPKQIYITKRAPAYSEAQWGARWRRHGSFVRSLPLWAQIRHYEQCRVLSDEAAAPAQFDGLSGAYDGVGMVWFRNRDAVGAALGDPTVQSVFEDEKDVFNDPIADTSLFCREVVFRDTGATTVKLVGFLRRRRGLSREQFSEAWEHTHGRLFLSVPEIDAHVTKYVQNHVLDEFTGPLGDDFDGVVEIGFADLGDVSEIFGQAYLDRVRPDEQRFVDLDTMIVLLTDEALLYEDALDPYSAGAATSGRLAVVAADSST